MKNKKNKKNLIKQIIYRSSHRGTKEMDILMGNFVKKNIAKLNDRDLNDLNEILNYEDEILHKIYFEKTKDILIKNKKIISMLKEFKL